MSAETPCTCITAHDRMVCIGWCRDPGQTARATSRPMMGLDAIAREALRCALAWEPNVTLVGNVMASELAALAASTLITCPKCGAEAWCDIDCDLCLVCSALMNGEMP
jgi:hypothetical protein